MRRGIALVLPVVVAVVQSLLWDAIQPFAWFLFYPVIFVSTWLDGMLGGIAATGISAVLVWWAFLPPEHTFAKEEARYFLALAVFLLIGVLISLLDARLRRGNMLTRLALDEVRETAAKLRTMRDQIYGLFALASDAILIADLEGRLTDANESASRMLGYSRAELITLSLFDLIDKSDMERLQQTKETLRGGAAHLAEWKLRRKDGAYVPVEVSSKILPDGRWQAFARDISERKLLQAHLQQTHRANRALSKCNQALIRAVEEAPLLQKICDIVVQDAGYRLAWVGHAEHDEAKSVRVAAQAGWEANYLEKLAITWADDERGRGPTGECIRNRRIVIANDIATDPKMAVWRDAAITNGYSSSIAIPLLIDSETYGALCIYAPEPDAFQSDEITLLLELASDLAFGISSLRTRAERIKVGEELRMLNIELEQRVLARTREVQESREREFEIGSKIQQTLLLDQPPAHLPGLRIVGLTLPTQRIDGDFYIFMEPRRGSLDVIVGDVMGKGIPAALLGAATKAHLLKAVGHLTALAMKKLPEPEEIVMLAHAEIARQLIDLESFVTLCYARIDTARRLVKLVDCGHTGTIQLHSHSGRIDLLHGDNLPLGVIEGEKYKQISAPIELGDVLLFFSDGITEARNSFGELFGMDRLTSCIRTNGGLQPVDMVETIRKEVVEFCGTDRLADDLTVVAVRIEEVGPPIARATLCTKSELGQLRCVREFVRSFCDRLPVALLDEDAKKALELAVNEAASNIMKHAYRGHTDEKIELEAEAFAGRIVIRLYDQGHPFKAASPTLPPIDLSRESGFGLYILTQSVDDVHYYRDEHGRNCIALTKFHTNPSPDESVNQWKLPSRTDKE